MKFMKRRNLRLFAVAALLPLMATSVPAQSNQAMAAAVAQKEDPGFPARAGVARDGVGDPASQQFVQMVRDFLAAVPKGDPQVFNNFFADDVIYTRSAGVTVDKSEIIRNIGVRAVNEPQATYEADDFTVHPYGEMAVVNFRLIQHNEKDGRQETSYFRNTGTFLKRNGKWQVVAWQATKVPAESAAK
jgi:ketosteroid isomerase-like protein